MPTDFNTGRFDAMREYAQRKINTDQFAGIAWQVSKDGETVEQGCAGHSNTERNKILQSDAIYRIYSMTKPMVSLRCLQLVEAGLLQLGDPVSRWLPSFTRLQVLNADGSQSPLERPITIEDLLTHRAGFSYDFLDQCPVAKLYRQARLAEDGSRTLDELVEVLSTMPLVHQPGSHWHYSYATDVIAAVIQAVCDQSLGDELKQALFLPLGMQDTAYTVPVEKQSRLMDMFGQCSLGGVPDAVVTSNTLNPMDVRKSHPLQDSRFERGGHGLYSTASDYMAFASALKDGRTRSGDALLSAPMLDFLWCNRLQPHQLPITIGAKPYPGYGWGLTGRVMVDPGQAIKLTVSGEGGWSGAASTWFWVDRQNAITGVIMTQYLGSALSVGSDMQALAYGALLSAAD